MFFCVCFYYDAKLLWVDKYLVALVPNCPPSGPSSEWGWGWGVSGAGEAEAVLRRSGVLGADCGATAGARSGGPVLRWSRHTASGPRSYLRLRHRARTTPSLALDMSYFMHPSTLPSRYYLAKHTTSLRWYSIRAKWPIQLNYFWYTTKCIHIIL